MKLKVTVARALTARLLSRTIKLATLAAAGTILLLFLGIWILTYYVNGWWGLLLIPLGWIVFIVIAVRLVLVFIYHRDITTVKNIIRESASLKSDFAALEALFQ